MLRGINVGGRHVVTMAELRGLLADAGFQDVATYVQSGNVVLTAGDGSGAVATRVSQLVGQRFGFEVPVAARSAAQLDAILARDPLAGAADDPKLYVVTFLSGPPPLGALERLHDLAGSGERLHAEGAELYTHHPDGQARSKLAAALTGAALGPSATARNWATVTRLARMARA